MNPEHDVLDLNMRSQSATPGDTDPDDLPDMTTPEEMYGGVIGNRAPSEPEPEA